MKANTSYPNEMLTCKYTSLYVHVFTFIELHALVLNFNVNNFNNM